MHKTELLLITGRHIPSHMDMSVGDEVIRANISVRYPGIRLNARLIFSYKLQYLADKDRWTGQHINDEYWRPATGEKEIPDGGYKQHDAIWKRNLCRNARG